MRCAVKAELIGSSRDECGWRAVSCRVWTLCALWRGCVLSTGRSANPRFVAMDGDPSGVVPAPDGDELSLSELGLSPCAGCFVGPDAMICPTPFGECLFRVLSRSRIVALSLFRHEASVSARRVVCPYVVLASCVELWAALGGDFLWLLDGSLVRAPCGDAVWEAVFLSRVVALSAGLGGLSRAPAGVLFSINESRSSPWSEFVEFTRDVERPTPKGGALFEGQSF